MKSIKFSSSEKSKPDTTRNEIEINPKAARFVVFKQSDILWQQKTSTQSLAADRKNRETVIIFTTRKVCYNEDFREGCVLTLTISPFLLKTTK
ncbi:hypothetical protein SCA6_011444 [Theobroma cacao]